MSQRLYVYKVVVDDGGAPCVCKGRLTLAICKPRIRESANRSDLIFGFAANSLSRDNRLIYVARVTKLELDGAYYDNPVYSERPDRIYVRGDDRRFGIRSSALYHAHGALLERDIGRFPDYARARVIVSDDFRYFGSGARRPAIELDSYPQIRRMLQALGQGHRVKHPPAVESELQALMTAARSLPSREPVGPRGRSAALRRCSPA